MANGKWLAVLLLLLCVGVSAHAEPPFLVLPTTSSLQVKLASPSSTVSYTIRHWPDGEILTTGQAALKADASGLQMFEITDLHPRLWSPQDPQLYEIEISGIGKVRFGFRAFQIRDRKFLLNGRPIMLFGVPINPPWRDLPEATGRDPEFIRGYLRLLKTAHVNIIRTDTQEWLDACDEVGMMTFQGNYGGLPGSVNGIPPPDEQLLPAYRRIISEYANHPSVVIYVLSNEIRYNLSPASLDALSRVRDDLRLLDPTRPVIGNAGFGGGKPGEIYDIHPYFGYYGGNLCDWSRLSRYLDDADAAGQPLTLSECVGAYTSDAGVFETMGKQMATMLRWAGPEEDQRSVALEYQAELVRQVVEMTRRMRTAKSGLAGVMPFTYFLGWANVSRADDLLIKPAFETLQQVYQPILISAECWHRNLFAGDTLKLRLCVTNDDDIARNLPPTYAEVKITSADGRTIASEQVRFPGIRYYSNAWRPVSMPIPAGTPKGDYRVSMSVVEGGKAISENSFSISVAPRDWVTSSGLSVVLFDPSGKTGKALRAIGVETKSVKSLKTLPRKGVLVIGEEGLKDENRPTRASVEAFLGRGGRILCLRQDVASWGSDWLPARFLPDRTSENRPVTCIHPIGGGGAIFDGLRSRDLRWWNENGLTDQGVPDIGPVIGPLKPESPDDLRNARIYAVCGPMMHRGAVVELFDGKGSIILSQFSCIDRASHDPFAARLLTNLVRYAASPIEPAPIDLSQPVRWDLEAWRRGVIQSPVQGFLPHSPVYQHRGESKGLLGADHRIDGVTLVGEYHHNAQGWIDPVPDPAAEGWGIVYGKLTKSATRFMLKARNASDSEASIRLLLDGKQLGAPMSLKPGIESDLEWQIDRKPGPLKLELRGDQRIVILESRLE